VAEADLSPAEDVTSLSPLPFSDPDFVAQPLSAIPKMIVPYANTRAGSAPDRFIASSLLDTSEKCRVAYRSEEVKRRSVSEDAIRERETRKTEGQKTRGFRRARRWKPLRNTGLSLLL
jgi:hypothetical protein